MEKSQDVVGMEITRKRRLEKTNPIYTGEGDKGDKGDRS
jgi:hypothetical protein